MQLESSFLASKYFRWFTAFMTLLYFVLLSLAVPKSYAAESPDADSAMLEHAYEQLASGQKLLQDKEYEEPQKPTVYLTFDDGPSKLTGQVLDILKEQNIRATFFALGEEAEAHPDLIKRIVNEGHTLGNHTYNHVYQELYSDFSVFWQQIQKTERIFQDIAGVKPKLIRAPGGTYTNFDAFYFYFLDQAGYTVYDWNIDSEDSKRVGIPAEKIISAVKNGPFLHEITLLMHDGSGHGETVKALPEIIRIFKEKGYEFAPLTEKVKPSQFGVGKPKWARSMSSDKFAKVLAQMRSYASANSVPDRESTERQGESAVRESGEALARLNMLPLQLHVGFRTLMLEPKQYELAEGRLKVPLRLLAENLGCQVAWNEEMRTANVHYGLFDVQYDLPRGMIRTYALGRLTHVYYLADMKLVDGSIVVPLRSTVELFGDAVAGYTLDSLRREVDIRPPRGIYIKEI
jgi:peptidoglycan/xylan/chitin deacetylase (PgdA/CDA1 family)